VARNDTPETADTAPSPSDPRKPDSPGEVSKPSWKYALKKTLREFSADQCTDVAARAHHQHDSGDDQQPRDEVPRQIVGKEIFDVSYLVDAPPLVLHSAVVELEEPRTQKHPTSPPSPVQTAPSP